jgi:hypothetical protein
MNRKSLVPGQEETITVSAFDEQGNPVMGYIDMPIRFDLEDPNIGEFSANDVYIFTGEREVTFKAINVGTTTLTVTMGDFEPRSFTINVYDEVDMEWKPAEEVKSGRSEFTIAISLKDPNGNDITNINGPLLLAPEQPADGGFENSGQLNLLNGKGTLRFQPTPGKKTVNLISKDPYISSDAYSINPTGGAASQLILSSKPHLRIGRDTEIQVIAADSFGFPAEDFNDTITLSLSDKSKEFAELPNTSIELQQGKGTFKIKAGKETADIILTAEHDDLNSATLALPLLARVDSADWDESFPQNLFASFVGFPAGDFTQEDYFGGTHLFNGKTEAVYSFLSAPLPETALSISPNHLISLTGPNQIVLVEFPGNEMLLQAFDRKNMRTLASKKTTLNLDSVEQYEGEVPDVGKMYVDILDSDYAAVSQGNGFQIRYLNNDLLADIQPNKIHTSDNSFKWVYEDQTEYDVIELILTDGLVTPARLLISLKPEAIKAENFEEISPTLKWHTTYGGASTNDPTGLMFSLQTAEVPEDEREEFYGIEGQQKYISLFGSGTNIGDAIKFNMPPNAILLGDPTIRLQTKSTSSLNYNSATGQQLYQDPEGKQIVSINHFNYDNDGNQDVALLMEDGRVRLLQGGFTEPPYKDRGNIAFLVDGGVAIETFDFKQDNYEDLLVATDEGRLAILNNDNELITRTDHKLNIGKKMYRLLKGDMDQDGFGDLVILDSRGDIFVFYYDSEKNSFPEN